MRWRDRALIAYARAFEHPSKIRIVRWLVAGLAAGRVRVRYATGGIVEIDPADYIGWEIFRTGLYEPATLTLALRIMNTEPGLFVDVGANCGWYTCAVAAAQSCKVVSIEPDCENCAALRRNIALGELQNVVVFNGAVGADFGVVEMLRRARGNSGTVAVRANADEPVLQQGWVATMPLDTLLERLVRPATRPILVKVDVEGFECQVLSGLDFDGPFRPKNVLLEFDRQISLKGWGSFDALRAFFAARRYELFDVSGRPLRETEEAPEANVWARERPAGAPT